MAASTIPTFKAALTTRLATYACGVQVSRGNPYPKRPDMEIIIIGDANVTSQDPVEMPLAAGRRMEQYDVEVIVSVIRPAQEAYSDANDRAHAIAEYVVNAVLTWAPSDFGSYLPSGWALARVSGDHEGLSEDGSMREASVTVVVSVTAHI